MRMEQADAIVPAFNEEQTVADVVRTLVASGEFRDVIVISDGSTDRTAACARAAGATVVHELPEKRGKGSAILHGLKHAAAPVIFVADADLRGFRPEHVRALLAPVRAGRLAMTVGLHDRGRAVTALERFLPLIGGERAFRREVLEDVLPEHVRGFRIEQAMNYHCRVRGWRYGAVPMRGVRIRTKFAKVPLPRALREYARMYAQVAAAMVGVRLAERRGAFRRSGTARRAS